jgi:hypothetical protein
MNRDTMRKLVKKGKPRLAASEVMGSILLMAVTLAVGFAVWAWASNAALSSEKSFGNSVNTNAGCLNLGAVIVNANFSSTNANLVTLWFYNNGHGAVNISNINISNATSVYVYGLVQSKTNTTGQLLDQTVKPLTLYYPKTFSKTAIYTFQAELHNESVYNTIKSSTTTVSAYEYQCGLVSPTYQQVTPSVI